MMTETQQPLNLQVDAFPEKAAPIMNSQGEVIQEAPPKPQEQPCAEPCSFDDVIGLGDTELAPPADCLMPPTDDTGMEHKIIGCGHVLKSTHDLARWSEKTGARRVNTQECIDSVSDLAINLEPNRTPRKKWTNTNTTSGGDPAADIRGLFEEKQRGGRRRGGNWQKEQQKWKPVEGEKSEVINCWPVLKSTHDQAQLSEKRGKNAVNKSESCKAIDELACNQKSQSSSWRSKEPIEANTQTGGNSLQSGMDTQAGSHIAMDCQQ